MIPRTKVFIGSLPGGSRPEELRRLFENYGVVTECDIVNRCGFIHMETPEMAENAIIALHNTNFRGSNITVVRGRIKERAPGDGVERSGMDGRMGGSQCLLRGNITRSLPRGNFASHSHGDIDVSGRFTRNIGGPMQRDRRGPPRGNRIPYKRNDGGSDRVNLPDRFQSRQHKGSVFFDVNTRQNIDGNLGMINQDIRGFSLLDRQQFHGNMESNPGGGRGRILRGNQRCTIGNNQSQLFERRSHGGFNSNRGGSMNTNIGGGMFRRSQGFKSNNMCRDGAFSSNNYNQSFPPLGSNEENRSAPQRRDMMSNRRY